MTLSDEGASSAPEEISASVENTEVNMGEKTAETPAAEGEQATSLLEHVQNVLKPQAKEAEAPPAGAQSEEKGPEEAAATAEAEPDDSNLPFHQHPRFKQVIDQKNTFKRERDDARRQLQELEPVKADAGNYQNIVGYMRESGLTSEEVNTGFNIMAAIKNDPAQAYELLQPYVTNLRIFLGHDLPEDLAAKVESGEAEEAVARELARTRHAAEFERQRRIDAERQQQEIHQRQSHQAASDRMTNALLGWEQQVKSTDPDWAKKEDMVLAYLRSENLARPPANEAQVLENAKAAYAKVNQAVAKIAPQRQQTARTVSSSQSVTGVRPEPKSALEAAQLALERSR